MVTWKIANMERRISDGIVFLVHWTANLEETGYYSATFGAVRLLEPEEGYDIIDYEDLTEEIVIGWLKDVYDTESTENYLKADIEKQKAPVNAMGTPWSQLVVPTVTPVVPSDSADKEPVDEESSDPIDL